jgi:hypothetical protein
VLQPLLRFRAGRQAGLSAAIKEAQSMIDKMKVLTTR